MSIKMFGLRNCFVIFFLLSKCLRAQVNFQKVEGVVGHSVELPCNVTAENENDKLSILAWYKNGSTNAFYSRDLRGDEQSTTSTDNRYRLVLSEGADEDQLQIDSVVPSDAGDYTCLADFAASPAHKTFIQLTVIEPPSYLWVVADNGTQVAKARAGVNTSQNIGPYYVGDTIYLACVAYGGKPRGSLTWWTEQRLLKNTVTPLSEQRVRSDLIYGPLVREDHGRVFTCSAKNNKKTTPLSIDIIVDMYLSPDLVSLRTNDPDSGLPMGQVRTGETLSLQCRVLGARPLPPITWKLDDKQLINLEQKITMDPTQRLVVSDVQLTIDERYDESPVTCCAPAQQHDPVSVCAQPLPLNVLYAPVVEIAVESEIENDTLAIVKGSNVTLACNHKANPQVDKLYWISEELKEEYSDNDIDTIQSILELKNVSEEDVGNYMCVATNVEGTTYSKPLFIDVIYPAYCKDENITEYGLGENEFINITCNVVANPMPSSYRWMFINDVVNTTSFKDHPYEDTDEPMTQYKRTTGVEFSTILCWGLNDVPTDRQIYTPCTFLITNQTVPWPPTNCEARKNAENDITVSCEKGYNGGMPQKFKFLVQQTSTNEQLMSIITLEPTFMFQEPTDSEYKFVIIAFNEKGDSPLVEIDKNDIILEAQVLSNPPVSAVKNITSLALALCGGVALVALAACGLVLCTYERTARADLPRDLPDHPLCAYNTEESNCETYHDSDDGSDFNVKRTESFRRAVSKHPSKNFDVRRTSSFHSARYMNDVAEQENYKSHDSPRRTNCRVHSLQNINRKRDMDALCDHLVLHLPPETNYNVPRPMNTFYTMPRKMRHKLAKELSDEASEITQTSDGFSLPPPPDEFGTYRAGTRIKDMPTKSMPTYTTIIKNNPKTPIEQQYSNPISSINTVGIPTISGVHSGVYSYPDDDHQGHQDTPTTTDVYQPYFTYRESGL